MTVSADRPLVVCTVGTDHHPFDRLVGWLERWAAARPRAEVIIQFGTSRSAVTPGSSAYMNYDELQSLLERASAVVCHGGPATIMECRRHGLVPVAVPRLKRYGEHVDDHQAAFVARLSRLDQVFSPASYEELEAILDRLLGNPAFFRTAADGPSIAAAVDRFSRRIAELFATPLEGEQPVRVLYLGGLGRSGSTLLERLVDQLSGFCALGELVHLWSRGVRDNELCGCGQAFHDCLFWQEVGQAAFGGWDQLDVGEVLELKHRVDRTRYSVQLTTKGGAAFRRATSRYGDFVRRVLEAAQAVSGAEVLVDSSKHPSTALVLRSIPNVDLRLVHLVRNSNGVIYSWTKTVARPERQSHTTYMPRYHPVRTAGRWLVHNGLFEGMARSGVPTIRVHYEHLASSPRTVLEEVSRFARVATTSRDLDFIGDDAVRLGPGHSVSGNPMRFKQGDVAIKLDDEWKDLLPASDRLLVSAMTWPLRHVYGYGRSDRRLS